MSSRRKKLTPLIEDIMESQLTSEDVRLRHFLAGHQLRKDGVETDAIVYKSPEE